MPGLNVEERKKNKRNAMDHKQWMMRMVEMREMVNNGMIYRYILNDSVGILQMGTIHKLRLVNKC